jgi:hypothetical protein
LACTQSFRTCKVKNLRILRGCGSEKVTGSSLKTDVSKVLGDGDVLQEIQICKDDMWTKAPTEKYSICGKRETRLKSDPEGMIHGGR